MTSLRFTGIYCARDAALYFKLHADGRAEARFFKNRPEPRLAAAQLGPGLAGYASGRFELEAEKLTLWLTFPFGENRYEGRVVDGGVELKYVAEGKDNPTKVYAFHELSAQDLELPLASRAHALRAKLSAGEVPRHHVEALADLGDPVAILALYPLEIERIARSFAELGAVACLRLLLALSWSDDGEWFTPKQGLTTGGSRKDDEGKTLRALAKWCLKPEEMALAKVEKELAEVIKVGADFKFLDAALRVIKAPDESARRAALTEALTFHVTQDPPGAFELARAKLGPGLLGTTDPLSDMLKRIK